MIDDKLKNDARKVFINNYSNDRTWLEVDWWLWWNNNNKQICAIVASGRRGNVRCKKLCDHCRKAFCDSIR
jgi:hypothetical protein